MDYSPLNVYVACLEKDTLSGYSESIELFYVPKTIRQSTLVKDFENCGRCN